MMEEEAIVIYDEDRRAKMQAFARKGEQMLKKPEGMHKILKLMARFPELSVENLILLLSERPDAVQLGLREDWEMQDNPVRKDAFPILFITEDGTIEEWFEVSDTEDPPSEVVRNEPQFYQGILPDNPIRAKSRFYRMYQSEPFRTIRLGLDYDGKAMKQLAELLVFGAPFP